MLMTLIAHVNDRSGARGGEGRRGEREEGHRMLVYSVAIHTRYYWHDKKILALFMATTNSLPTAIEGSWGRGRGDECQLQCRFCCKLNLHVLSGRPTALPLLIWVWIRKGKREWQKSKSKYAANIWKSIYVYGRLQCTCYKIVIATALPLLIRFLLKVERENTRIVRKMLKKFDKLSFLHSRL